jgi:hypothetical protein
MQFNYTQENTSNFIKLNDGESITGVLKGEPMEYEQHWEETYACLGKKECDICARDPEAKAVFRFRVHFIQKTKEGWKSMILEQGYRVYESFKGFNEAGIDLTKTPIKITRIGTSQATKYMVVPLMNLLLTEKDLLAIRDLESPKLNRGIRSKLNAGQSQKSDYPTEDLPF